MNPPKPKSNRLAIILTVSLGLVCLGWVLVDSHSRKDMARLKKETLALQAKLEVADRAMKSSAAAEAKPQPPDELPSSPPSVVTPPSATITSAAAAKSESKRRVNAEEVSAMVKNPMMQKIMASQTSAVMQMTYGDLMNHLELAPEERDYLQKLLVEKQTGLATLGMQLMNSGLSSDEREAIMKQLGEAWKSGEAKIHDFLNDEADFAYYKSYSQQEPERKEVGMFEASLTGGDSLSPATSDALANLQSEARKNFGFTVDFYNQQNFGNPAVLNAAAVHTFLDEQTRFQSQVADKAANLLTPAQLQVFKQNQSAVRQMAGMQLNYIMQMASGGQ